jgi:hypothetical protein
MKISNQQINKSTNKQTIILLLLCILFVSCKPNEKFPIVPHLEFVSLEKIDSKKEIDEKALLILYFTDGDGNVGLDPTDNKPPFDSLYYHNFFMVYHAKRNGEFIAFPEFNFNARLPRFLSTNAPEPIKGDIEYIIPIRNPLHVMLIDSVWVPVPEIDTVMFECWLLDRDLNKSNSVFTPAITVKNR